MLVIDLTVLQPTYIKIDHYVAHIQAKSWCDWHHCMLMHMLPCVSQLR